MHAAAALGLCLLLAAPAWALVPGGIVASRAATDGTADSLEVTIRVERAPSSTSRYFWAQQFFPASQADHGGYFGIQTGGNAGGKRVGKLFIFSIWNASGAEAAPGAIAQRFAGEGTGHSVRMPYDWKEGASYRFRLEKDGPLWWRLTVTDPERGELALGRIKIAEDVALRPRFTSFTEHFGELGGCGSLEPARVAFEDLRFGTARVGPGEPAPYGRCAARGKGAKRGAAALHEVGDVPGGR